MKRWLLRLYGRLYVRLLARIIEDDGIEQAGGVGNPYPEAEVRRLAQREIDAIGNSIIAHFDYQDREQRILNDRLSRRFDLGMALNEAANRAITEKKTGAPAFPIGYPTEKQKLALKLQEETLRERLKNS